MVKRFLHLLYSQSQCQILSDLHLMPLSWCCDSRTPNHKNLYERVKEVISLLSREQTASGARHRGKSWPTRRRAKSLSETLKVIYIKIWRCKRTKHIFQIHLNWRRTEGLPQMSTKNLLGNFSCPWPASATCQVTFHLLQFRLLVFYGG